MAKAYKKISLTTPEEVFASLKAFSQSMEISMSEAATILIKNGFTNMDRANSISANITSQTTVLDKKLETQSNRIASISFKGAKHSYVAIALLKHIVASREGHDVANRIEEVAIQHFLSQKS